MKTKIIIIVVVIVAAAVGAYFLFAKKAESKIEYRSAKVEKGDIEILVTATGSLSADTTVQVGTQVSGTISKILVDFNSVVRKGQVIAIIDTTFLAAAVVDAQASLFKASVSVDLTKRNYDRTKELFDQKVMAQADYDQAYSDWQTAVANSRSAKASLDRAKINLKYATIVAPVSGVVVSRAVDVGQTMAASFSTPTLFSIANDLTKMQVQASIDEADIGKIQNGQQVTFTVDAYENLSFIGKVSQIRLQPTITQNVVKYTVIINVPNPDLKLLPGMTANITVHVQQVTDVLKVPASALRYNPSQEVVDKMMKIWPDSIKQKVQKLIDRRKNNGRGDQPVAQSGSSGRRDQPVAQSGSSGRGNQPGTRSESPGRGDQPGTRSGSPGRGDQMVAQTGSAARSAGGQGMNFRKNSGTVWVKKGEMLIPYRVKLGLSDGSFTEITEGNIKEGDDVITGIVSQQNPTAAQQTSPFQPQMRPTTRGGGR
jgi:HlyD family secretion protein